VQSDVGQAPFKEGKNMPIFIHSSRGNQEILVYFMIPDCNRKEGNQVNDT